MKKIVLLFVLVSLVNIVVFSQTFVKTQHDVRYVGDNKFISTGTVYAEKDINKKFGISTFALVTNDWGEILIGPYYRINSNLVIGLQVGMETIDPYWRGAASISYFKEKDSLMCLVEKGSSKENYWYTLSY